MRNPKNLLDLAMSPDVLDQAWRKIRRKHTPWSVTVSRDGMERHLLAHVLKCRDEILSRQYRPQPMRQFTMEKPGGGKRILSAQYLRDKLVQRALLIILEPRAEKSFHPDSYAYRPGRSVAMALTRVRERVNIGQSWLVDADIRSFFDSIPHKQLLQVLKSFICDNDTMRLINRWLAQGAHHTSLLRKRRGISQGAILSPLFCNLYLTGFDNALSKRNIPFVRFADDFLLFADKRDKAEKALAFASVELEKLGLNIHPEKTRIVKSSPGVRFLGEKLPKSS
ncbi:MAG: Retron-type reverse transcriptase [Desulfocapsa sp.]|nr:MAG: Retron-type reverse transcriptase [Desulfocapsa sp.]